jgi:hypothetical protein
MSKTVWVIRVWDHGEGALQTDSLLSRLKALKERIDSTEAHVTLDLDHRRNQIVSFNLVSSAGP